MKARTNGFTLIELLVVIAIIGILATTVLVSMSASRGRGKDTAVKADLATIQTQGSLYYSIGNSFGQVVTSCTPATGNMFNDTTTVVNATKSAVTDAAKNTKDKVLTCRTNCIEADGDVNTGKCATGTTNSFIVYGQLNGGTGTTYWCVDSRGNARQVASVSATATLCPAS